MTLSRCLFMYRWLRNKNNTCYGFILTFLCITLLQSYSILRENYLIMIDVTIEKAVDLPADHQITYRGKWKLFNEKTSQMEVGDSFFVDVLNTGEINNVRTLYMVRLYRMMEKHNLDWKFSSRTVEGGLRFFRVN